MDIENGSTRQVNGANGLNGDGSGGDSGEGTVVEEARALWPGWRGIEEYAREVFVCAHKRHLCSSEADEDPSPWRKLPTG